MVKRDIAATIAVETGLTLDKTAAIVQRILNTIARTLATEGRVELRRFGVLEVRRRAAVAARNPRTGATVNRPERNAVRFKPGRELERLIQQDEGGYG
jgi:integration host factor subunit beta